VSTTTATAASVLAEIEGRAEAVERSWDIAPPGAAFVADSRADSRKMAKALRAVLAVLDRVGPEVAGFEHDDWVWLEDANQRLEDITAAITAALSVSEAGK